MSEDARNDDRLPAKSEEDFVSPEEKAFDDVLPEPEPADGEAPAS